MYPTELPTSILIMGDLDLNLQGHLALENLEFWQFWLVRAISRKVLDEIWPNLHKICILLSLQHLIILGDLDLHLQGHLGQKPLKLGHFGPIAWSIIIHGVIFSPIFSPFEVCKQVHFNTAEHSPITCWRSLYEVPKASSAFGNS